MFSTRFQILCPDGQWRYVFCRSVNSTDPVTGCAVISTEARGRAFVAYSATQAEKDREFFTESAHGAAIRFAS